MSASRPQRDEWLWLLLRLVAGGFLVPHGAQKLFGILGSPGIGALSAMFERSAGLVPGAPFVFLTGAIEFAGGLMLMAGLATRFVAAASCALLIGAILLVNARAGFFWMKGGFEYAAMWAVLCACFAIRGGGIYALDRALTGRFPRSTDK